MSTSNAEVVSVPAKLGLIAEPWSPGIVASLNGQEVKLARLDGAFVWHKHDDADELFYVLEGSFRMELRDRPDSIRSVELGVGDLIVVPRGVEHRPVADEACSVMLFEPAGVVNTGDAPASGRTNAAVRL
ncbi:MAG: cupin domain-containing protein [Planctomycetota bacterium]